MLAGIREILIISTPHDLPMFESLLGDGSQWGIDLSYKEQPSPDGLAQALIIGETFIGDNATALILGDNIFYGHDYEIASSFCFRERAGSHNFCYHVKDPERYGVAEFDQNNQVKSLEEKPINPKSNFAVTGCIFMTIRPWSLLSS